MGRKLTRRQRIFLIVGIWYALMTVFLSCMLMVTFALEKTLTHLESIFEPPLTAITNGVTEHEYGKSDVVFHNGSPTGLWLHDDGSLLIADSYNKVVWSLRIGESPRVYTGRLTVRDAKGTPVGGYNDANLADSAYLSPWGIAEFLDGYILSDPINNVIRFFDGEKVFTAVGSGTAGYSDGYSINTEFNRPTGVAVDDTGNLYIADTGNHLIRLMDKNGNVSTYAGSYEGCADGELRSAAFRNPTGLYWYDGALYVADSGNHRICRIADGKVTVVAGLHKNPPFPEETFEHGGYVDGSISEAMFSNPQGVAVTQTGDVYVADTGNHAMRIISNGQVSTVRIIDVDANEVYPISPVCILIDGGFLYIADEFAGVVFRQSIN